MRDSLQAPSRATPRACGIAVLLLTAVLGACDSSDLSWTDPRPLAPAASEGRLVVDAQGRTRLVPDSALTIRPPRTPGMCASSVRMAAQMDSSIVAVWWAVRPDSSAVLEAALSSDRGAHWGAPVPVDTADVSTAGCDRPPPAIATSVGFVHLVYSMKARDGTGVFYVHSMTRGRSYEPPIAMIYGDRLTRAAVGADRGLVAVAYEDPNGPAPQIGLALSRSWGHAFEDRSRLSAGSGTASDPQVAVTDRDVAVSWMVRPRMGDSNAPATRLVRVGRAS